MKKILPILMAVVLVFAMAIPCFASTVTIGEHSVPSEYFSASGDMYSIQDAANENATVFIVWYEQNNVKYYELIFADNSAVITYIENGYYRFKALSETYIQRFIWNTDGSTPPYFDFKTSSNYTSSTSFYGFSDSLDGGILWSSQDIYNTDTGELVIEGNTNFPPPPPLAEVIQGVTEETIKTETLPAVAGTMSILTLCGVGLMACLVVLSLFGKRSLISRG